ncbi:MAG: hypothetical protein AB1393_05015 [Candidatus Edwardsbacteria bacterium]
MIPEKKPTDSGSADRFSEWLRRMGGGVRPPTTAPPKPVVSEGKEVPSSPAIHPVVTPPEHPLKGKTFKEVDELVESVFDRIMIREPEQPSVSQVPPLSVVPPLEAPKPAPPPRFPVPGVTVEKKMPPLAEPVSVVPPQPAPEIEWTKVKAKLEEKYRNSLQRNQELEQELKRLEGSHDHLLQQYAELKLNYDRKTREFEEIIARPGFSPALQEVMRRNQELEEQLKRLQVAHSQLLQQNMELREEYERLTLRQSKEKEVPFPSLIEKPLSVRLQPSGVAQRASPTGEPASAFGGGPLGEVVPEVEVPKSELVAEIEELEKKLPLPPSIAEPIEKPLEAPPEMPKGALLTEVEELEKKLKEELPPTIKVKEEQDLLAELEALEREIGKLTEKENAGAT